MGLEAELDLELDILTKKDLQEMKRGLVHDLSAPYAEKMVAAFSAVTDGTGKAAFRVFDIPDGKTFLLSKFIAWGDAHNPSTGGIYSNAASWAGLFHGQPSPINLADFWPYPEAATGQVLPYTREYGEFIEFRQNDNVYFQIVGGPVTENITIILFGELRDLKVRRGRARGVDRGKSQPDFSD